ncbi:MAG: glycyl radical protein [Clostridia bacterium]|nr:glycyl radical protein [Clostridia bacterium]
MNTAHFREIPKTERITKLIENLYQKMPEVEPDRAILLTESYKETENLHIYLRRAKAFEHILDNIPIVIRDHELIVGSGTKAPRGCQVYPEFSFAWLESELDTIHARSADPFYVSEDTKKKLREVFPYWKNKTTSELAESLMAPETKTAMAHNLFTPGNYFYNGIGHVTVDYGKILAVGYNGIIKEAKDAMAKLDLSDADYADRYTFLQSIVISCEAVIRYAARYASLALSMSKTETDDKRKAELLKIAENCLQVPANGARSFYEACQSFWFVQMLIQIESSGHSISPGRFDQYMYPYFEEDMARGSLTYEFAQELMDCIWVKLNDLNKARDAASAEGFAGYSLFQNLIAGGQTKEGLDATNDLSYMSIQATMHVMLPQPSFSVRVWNNTPHEFMCKAAELTRTGVGLPAYYNDEVIIPSLLSRGLTIEDAREYNIIGCVEPQKWGKTDGWHDAAFFNMCRIIELVFDNGKDNGTQVGIPTGDVTKMTSFEEVFDAYKAQMEYTIKLMVNANNAIDIAHARRCPLPFLSSMVEDCIGRGKSVQEGGAVYNFTGPQGFGIANMADAMYTIKKLVFEDKAFTMAELKEALQNNFGETVSTQDAEQVTTEIVKALMASGKTVTEEQIASIYKEVVRGSGDEKHKAIREKILTLPKFGNDIPEIDALAREVAYTYTRPMEQHKNPRGGIFQAGLYPVSANVPLGAQTGATPDGRLAYTPVADGVSPSAGADVSGPTASANSVSKLDHAIASNGTLFNMKFHPSALKGQQGIESFVALIRGYFDQKGSHMQFNVVSRETLRDAQAHPENYKSLVVRVAGYSAHFTTLSKSLQDDIIRRTEQSGF